MPRHAIETKWLFTVTLLVIASLAHSVWAEVRSYQNRQAVLIGNSVDCHTRPFPKGLACNPRVDGIDCIEGSRNWLAEWHEPIDFACAQFGPQPVFVFSTYRDLEWDAETIRLIRQSLNFIEENRETETLEIAEVSG